MLQLSGSRELNLIFSTLILLAQISVIFVFLSVSFILCFIRFSTMSLINLLKIRVQITIMTSKNSLFLLARLHKKNSLWNHLPVLNYFLSPCVFPTSQDTSKTRGFLFALSDGLLCQLAHAPSYPTLHTHPLPLCPWVLQPSLMSHFARLQHFQRHTDHPPMEILTNVPAASDFLCNEKENKQDVFTIKPCFQANCLHTIPSFIHY